MFVQPTGTLTVGRLSSWGIFILAQPLQSWSDRGIKHVARRSHIPLLQRQTGETLETKLAAQEAKDERKRVAAEAAEAAAGLEAAPAAE